MPWWAYKDWLVEQGWNIEDILDEEDFVFSDYALYYFFPSRYNAYNYRSDANDTIKAFVFMPIGGSGWYLYYDEWKASGVIEPPLYGLYG